MSLNFKNIALFDVSNVFINKQDGRQKRADNNKQTKTRS